MRISLPLLSTAVGLGLTAAVLGTGPAATAAAPQEPVRAAQASGYLPSAGSGEDAAANRAFFEAVVKSVAKKRAADASPSAAASVTVYYSAANAPSFRTQISRSAQIWNSSVSNVRLAESSSGADFAYYEGNDSRGSYASTDGHGRGYIFLDYRQNQQYDSTRVTAHETGHVLGLPDHYSGPCSELMSGGGPGPSCTNPYPNSNERSRVNQLWAYGFQAALDKALEKTSQR
ncbi:snapalysin [Streptomyces coelicoflavus]|uniref:Extracellular small neutral protease n=1 Tax=Streptomyces coelicoflavus TaxID=285562 RepID=A0A7K3PH38_9ACTN|nr:snapalysin [Streptomyces coelicoflavus]NEB09314.1 snapalysin [Streptomyces coelicoflavus]